MDLAASNGHLDVVKWLHANRNEGCTKFAMSQAAVNGHLEVVWLHENSSKSCWKNVFDSIARYCYRASPCCGDFIRPREYYEQNTFITKQFPMIQWLHENHLGSCTTKAMDSAAANGNFELVKWLHENTTAECTHRAMDARGRLDIVKWLHENRSEGCTAAAMDNAATGGFLELMKWLRANRPEGCTPKALYAAACGDLEAVQWLFTGTNVSKELQAIAHGHLKAVQWLVDHYEGFDITATMERAIICKEPEIVCYLDAQRADRTQSVGEMRARLRNAMPFFQG